jgi:hypothetical protein
MPPSTTLDLFSAAHRLAECAGGVPITPEGRDRWFEEVEIHLLAIRALLDVHTDECAADDASRVLLWDAPRVAPMLHRLQRDCRLLQTLTTAALAAVRSPERTVAHVRHTAAALTRRIGVHRSWQDGVYHEAFAVDIGGPG